MKNIEQRLAQIENTVVDVMAALTPWLAPIPSAWLIGRATIQHLGWHLSIAVIAGIAVECIGVVSIVLALRLHEWNQTKRQSDPVAPVWLALVAVAFYFTVTISLTVLLDVSPVLAHIAPAIFPLLAAVGAVNIAIKRGQNHRETAQAQERQERKQARQEVKAVARQETRQEDGNLPQAVTAATSDFRQFKRTATREELLQIATMETAEIMATYRLDNPRTARNWRQNARQLTANGHAANVEY
jgi:hypothetical protein